MQGKSTTSKPKFSTWREETYRRACFVWCLFLLCAYTTTLIRYVCVVISSSPHRHVIFPCTINYQPAAQSLLTSLFCRMPMKLDAQVSLLSSLHLLTCVVLVAGLKGYSTFLRISINALMTLRSAGEST